MCWHANGETKIWMSIEVVEEVDQMPIYLPDGHNTSAEILARESSLTP